MTLQELGSIGELVGGVAVFVSFLFLGWQVRQNSKMIRAQIRQSFADNTVHGTMTISSNPDLRRVIYKINTGEKLNDDELIVWWGYAYSTLQLWQNHYLQVQMGSIPARDWEVQRRVAGEMDIYSKWLKMNWKNVRGGFDPDFAREMDSVLEDTSRGSQHNDIKR